MAEATCCSIEGCTNPRKLARSGWCQKHYMRWWSTGSTELAPRPTWQERLFSKVDVDHPLGCWTWTAAVNKSTGYGYFWKDNTMRLVHRVVFEELRGPIPDGLQLDHLCRNTVCVNPDHLEPVTNLENSRRGAKQRRGAARECPHGHVLDSENTYSRVTSTGRVERRCKRCRRESMRRQRPAAMGA